MMRLKDWNQSLQLANEMVEILQSEGFDVTTSSYTMYQWEKGIKFRVYDANGDLFKELSSGICESFEEMNGALYSVRVAIENL